MVRLCDFEKMGVTEKRFGKLWHGYEKTIWKNGIVYELKSWCDLDKL